MKKLILLTAVFLGLNATAQVDKNFDGTWPTNGLYPANDPQGWMSTNVLTNALASASNPTSVTQSTLNCNGGFSMRVETRIFTLGVLTGLVPDTCGFAFTGTVQVGFTSSRLVDGFPYNLRPASIPYCYKAEPQPNDTCGVGVLLWKWNGSSRTVVGAGLNLYPTTTSSMSTATLNIAYTNTLTPDSMAIYVGSSYKFPSNGTSIRKGAKNGSVMYVDNFNFPAPTTGLQNIAQNEVQLAVYPNPVSSVLFVKTDSDHAKSMQIMDITGKVMDSLNFDNRQIKLDVSKYNTGIYFYKVIDSQNNALKTGKFTVTH